MTTIEYNLFRVKFIIPSQLKLFEDKKTPAELFKLALKEQPSTQNIKGSFWHIGNLEKFSRDRGYFKFGRTRIGRNTKFDERRRDFVEEEFHTSPFTHVVYNTKIGFIGIAHNHQLARRPETVATKLETVLQGTTVVTARDVEVIIAPVYSPNSFLETIDSAFRVLQFTAHFTGPNPFDADEYFQKPLSVYAQRSNATRGKALVEGEELSKEVISAVARSTAATGNKAAAKVIMHKGQQAQTVNLSGDPTKRSFEESTHDPQAVLEALEELYKEIRQDE